MRNAIAVASVTLIMGIASAQIPVPDLNQTPSGMREQRISRVVRGSSFLSPTVSYAAYTIEGQRRFGASLILQYSIIQSRTESLDLLGGVMFRFKDPADQIDMTNYAPMGFQDPYSDGRSTRHGLRFGMMMLGADMTVYLVEGDVRPYMGFGGMLMIFPYEGIGATIAPDVKAGLQVNVANGFSGFAELRHVFGLPFAIGAPSTAFKDLTGFAFGMSFTPRFN